MSNDEHSDDEAVYVISIASQLSEMHPQTLRQYDRMGLVSPGRASGRGRRYSLRDIASLRNIQRANLLSWHRSLPTAFEARTHRFTVGWKIFGNRQGNNAFGNIFKCFLVIFDKANAL